MRDEQFKRNQRKRVARPRQRMLPPCIPDSVLHDGISFAPDATEIALERELRRAIQFRAEQQRDFLAEAVKRLAAVAIEVDRDLREIALAKEQEAIDKWHEAESLENAKLIERLQEELDRPTLLAKQKQLADAAKDIRRQNAQIERDKLLARGVVRGRRR